MNSERQAVIPLQEHDRRVDAERTYYHGQLDATLKLGLLIGAMVGFAAGGVLMGFVI